MSLTLTCGDSSVIRRFCARDGNETLFAGSVENHGDAMDADLGGDALSGSGRKDEG